MTTPRVTLMTADAGTVAVDVLVVGALSGAEGATYIGDPAYAWVSDLFETFDFTGAADALLRLPAIGASVGSVAVIGLGSAVTVDALRNAAGSAVRQLGGAASVAIALPLATEAEVLAVVEGATLGSYSFTTFKGTSKKTQKVPTSDVTVLTDVAVDQAALDRIGVLGDAVRMVKDLVNTPGAQIFPASLAQVAVDAAAGLPITVEVWDETKLAAEGCGGILGVGQGSSRKPRLVKVSYAPAEATTHLAFVGKGITYDTGGYSLKPWDSMLTMHHDMAGAATTLAVTLAAARLNLPVRLTAWMCLAENLVSSTAIRPNDVLTMRNGTTVEVINTDAEGRLVMADGLSLASEEHPDAIIDIATLTGAAIVALGRRTAGVMGDDDLVARVVSAGKITGEAHWPMPLPSELRRLLDSKFADLANLSAGSRDAGMLLAGIFLQEFVGTAADGGAKIPWAHLDIAGTGTNNGPGYGIVGDGGTGASVRTVLQLVESLAVA